ncbi:hypothetical protein KEH51_08000 [[Brevibacterium] frigoritolerans]|uniref:Uncharacterized protein n=1 Tax=Peribacillus frigoritolerans TaxID=450367 RepID=A0A941JA90_9BACI|nr:hypothetical protein [Peribacillus frigoritolerans]
MYAAPSVFIFTAVLSAGCKDSDVLTSIGRLIAASSFSVEYWNITAQIPKPEQPTKDQK